MTDPTGPADVPTVERAISLLRHGKPLASAAICGAILAREPRNAIAAHLLGLALKDTGDWEQGEHWLKFSITLEPQRGEFHANLGNLLSKSRRFAEAEAAYREALRRLPGLVTALRGLAQTLVDLGRWAEAEAQCRVLLGRDSNDAETWETLALALTPQGRRGEAEHAHRRAIALKPDYAVAHHNLGELLVTLERPDAMDALERARNLGADGYEVAYNFGRAAVDAGDLERAETEFARAVELQPLNPEAHRALASLRFMRGDPAFVRSLSTAVRAHRDQLPLQIVLAELLWHSGELPGAETLLRDALTRNATDATVRSTLARVLLDQGRLDEAEAEALEAASLRSDGPAAALHLVTVLIARGRPAEARPFIAAQLQRDPLAPAWLAFESTAARMLGEERHRALCDYERFVRAFDLPPPPGFGTIAEFNAALAAVLEDRHRFKRQPLDRTLRNGTQTSRSLLSDPEPVVQAALAAFQTAVLEYRAGLEVPPEHPLARIRDGAVGFAGAWSVRLERAGFQVNHHRSGGLVSAVYDVVVPEDVRDPALKLGWLKFGEPRYPPPGVGPEYFVEPRAGRLVLFPSYLWHGTNPIYSHTPRLSIAFDAGPPA